jgi:hypothetical protein
MLLPTAMISIEFLGRLGMQETSLHCNMAIRLDMRTIRYYSICRVVWEKRKPDAVFIPLEGQR